MRGKKRQKKTPGLYQLVLNVVFTGIPSHDFHSWIFLFSTVNYLTYECGPQFLSLAAAV